MAVITPTDVAQRNDARGKEGAVIEWLLILAADTCTAVQVPFMADKSVQIDGTFDSATVKLQGSIDGVTYFDLTDPQGNAISKTAAALEQVTELVKYIKPVTSGGGGSSSVNVRVMATRNR